MKEKVTKLGLKREKGMMYFIRDGAVWKVPMKVHGKAKGRQSKVVDCGLNQDSRYLYFLDKQGDVSRALRASAGGRKKKAAKKPAKRKAAAKRKPAKRGKKR